jgi:hypothetical protein
MDVVWTYFPFRFVTVEPRPLHFPLTRIGTFNLFALATQVRVTFRTFPL